MAPTTTAASSSKSKLKSKTKQATSTPAPPPVSAEFIDSEAEESGSASGDDDESDSDSSSSGEEADSDEDLEGITPKKSKVAGTEGAVSSAKPGKTLPKYTPPNGMSELKISTAFVSSPFEWDALASKPGVEIWAIRAPRDLKPSRLSAMTVSTAGKNVIGSLNTKTQTYTLSAAGSSKHTHTVVDEEGRQPTAGPGLVDAMAMDVDGESSSDMRVEGGEEMEGGMRLLVPRAHKQGKADGKLYVAPVPITRHLLLTPETTSTSEPTASHDPRPLPSFLSTSVPDNTETPSAVHPDTALPAKRPQPTHLMKFRNHAYGFHTAGPAIETTAVAEASQTAVSEKKHKEKRRKSEGKADSPVKKKAKKAKA